MARDGADRVVREHGRDDDRALDEGRSSDHDEIEMEGEEVRRSAGRGDTPSEPRLSSRVLVTWIELTVVGITGGLLGATVGGPPGFVIYLATTLVTVGIIFYNVNELIKAWVGRGMANEDRS